MAAYAALISLSNTIDRVLNHHRISISPEENQQLLSLLEHANSFEAFLEKFPDKFNSLEGRMRELAHEAEDIIEYFMLDQLSSWTDFQTKVIMILLEKKIKKIHSKEYEGGADSPAVLATSSTAPPIRNDSMGSFKDYVIDLKDSLCGEPSKLQVIAISGRDGIGKTTLARYLYHDPLIMEHFEIRVWVKVSQYYNPHIFLPRFPESSEKVSEVSKFLMERRYLLVLDDIWDEKAWGDVRRVFPDIHNGSRIMLTTRLSDLASNLDPSSKLFEMVLLNEDQSWDLLKRKVFGDEECPSQLENIGKEIARCCKGLPLALAMMAGTLSTITRTYVSWKEWAEEYRDESRCYQHQLHLQKVMEEIGLIAGEVREIKDISSNDVQLGAAPSAALSSSLADSINNSNTLQLSAAASSSGKVMSVVQLGDSRSSNNGVQHVMVGFEDYLIDLKDRLCGEPSKKLQVIPICGMGGIGKTTLARNLYDDKLIVSHFDVRVWVTISQDFSAQRILSSLVKSLKEFDKGGLGQSDDEKVHKILFARRYLVVMDDIWSREAWDVVGRVFSDDGNGSRVMLTTRLSDVASYPDPSSKLCEVSLLNADESWNLLKQNVFGDEDCPSKLEDIGKQIAGGCKGLPLAIMVIAGHLSTTMRSLDSWKVIAENVKSAAHDQIEEILYLSYVHLPQYLRPCFLYMGSFPEDHEIHVSRLITLWIAEGLVKSPIDSDSFERVAAEFLEELVKRSLVLVSKREWDGRIKSCSLHDLMRDLCIRKSHESKFLLNMRDSCIGKKSFIENIRNQRRINVDSSNIEFLSSLRGSTIRSIKCSKRLKRYSQFLEIISGVAENHSAFDSGRLGFLENVRLIRVLDGETFYVYDFLAPVHLNDLLHLRYLVISDYGRFPISLSRLHNLQTLVILYPYSTRSLESIELKWCMSQLRHVYYDGTIDFEDPKETDCPLESLQTLSYVSLSTCRETILKMIPNLKKLLINCSEGLPSDGGVCLDDLVHLHRLETLEIYAEFGQIQYYKITFPRMLKKLILRRCRLPWNDIFVVGSLPNLQVLELSGCACVGGTWETIEGSFPVLEVLKISRSDFKNWVTESSHFPRLKLLMVHYCNDLNGIPSDIGEIPTLQLIEVKVFKLHYLSTDKSLIQSVELIREEQEEMGNNTLQVVHSAHPYIDAFSSDVDKDFSGWDDDFLMIQI